MMRAIDAIHDFMTQDKHGNFRKYNKPGDPSYIDQALARRIDHALKILSERYWDAKLERTVINNSFSKARIRSLSKIYRKLHDELQSLSPDEHQYIKIELEYQKPGFDALDHLEGLQARADFFENLSESLDGRARPHIARAVQRAADIFEMCSHHARSSNSRYDKVPMRASDKESPPETEIVFQNVSTQFIYILMKGIDPDIMAKTIQSQVHDLSRKTDGDN
ncbi:hypothetical protein ACO34A_01695 [Rhizobium sp. ACO-34A]|nr:hypothetical protein ACO34A_01695 [Rhizobium sp. ACO-34A]